MEKKEELLSKMRVQEQRVTQIQAEADLKKKEVDLQKKDDDLQQMMTDLREHFKELSMQREVCILACVHVRLMYISSLRNDHLESRDSLLES